MNTALLTFLNSGLRNWKTTLIGLGIAFLTALQTGAFDGKHGVELAISIGIFLYGFVSRDANKSSQDSGVREAGPGRLAQQLSSSLVTGGNGRLAEPETAPPMSATARLLPCWLGLLLGLTSCAVTEGGVRTFAGLDAAQWGKIGLEAGKGAVIGGLPEYRRQKTAVASASLTTSGKTTREVLP